MGSELHLMELVKIIVKEKAQLKKTITKLSKMSMLYQKMQLLII